MHALRCYRCGASLAKLSLPLTRRDHCPECRVDLHVCRMCAAYDPRLASQCAEEAAEEVHEKARANFCEFFVPNEQAFAPGRMTSQQRAEAELDALFRPSSSPDPGPATAGDDDDAMRRAEALFED